MRDFTQLALPVKPSWCWLEISAIYPPTNTRASTKLANEIKKMLNGFIRTIRLAKS